VKLDFPEIDEDPNLKDAAEELKKRGKERIKQLMRASPTEENPENKKRFKIV